MLTSAFRSRRLMAVLSLLLLLLLLPLLTAAMTHGLVVQHLAMEPQDQIAEIGARVTLPCRVVNKQGVLQWTRDDFGLGTRRQLAGFERYAMIGSDEEGDFSLQIWPVELEDDAQFQCQVSAAGHGQFFFQFQWTDGKLAFKGRSDLFIFKKGKHHYHYLSPLFTQTIRSFDRATQRSLFWWRPMHRSSHRATSSRPPRIAKSNWNAFRPTASRLPRYVYY